MRFQALHRRALACGFRRSAPPVEVFMDPLRSWCAAVSTACCLFALGASAQPAGPLRPPRAAAQVDVTGNWVAQITEDWRWRMITPPKGDYASVPLNAAGRQVADGWDAAADAAAGEACRAFGAGGIMRLPTRLRVVWADDSTLRVETDLGTRVRTFHFGRAVAPDGAPSWQGYSVGEWLGVPPQGNPFGALVAPTLEAAAARGAAAGGAPAGRAAPVAPPPTRGSLKVVTTNLRPGYLRKNGVPYSERAVVTEYYDRFSMFGNDYLQVVTVVTDPTYLTTPFVVSNQFKREPDGSKWNPTPCATDPPLGTLQPPAF
jgi:hypothetical protein